MTGIEITRHLSRMRRDWDRRALQNARHYVVTGQNQWSDEEFYRSGEVTLQEEILNDLDNICQGKDPKQMRMLEIGCGAGRVTRAFAGFFGEVWGVDISREMVRQAREACVGFSNVTIVQNNGKDLRAVQSPWRQWLRREAPLAFDFAFSFMVFQHIPSRRIIESYVREVHRLLRPGGLFKFQVQGSPLAEADAEHSWVGISFSERDAREMAKATGFEMRYHHGAGEQYYWLWFFKP
jgi:cyclopropane fatty-acyl-phospholipid synthase-like methyltransferase